MSGEIRKTAWGSSQANLIQRFSNVPGPSQARALGFVAHCERPPPQVLTLAPGRLEKWAPRPTEGKKHKSLVESGGAAQKPQA